jgi:hypothetical protein
MVLCGPWASSIQKSLAGLPVQLGQHVPNARAHISKALDIKAIMGLQNVRACSAVNAYKTCKQMAIVQLQCSVSTVDHTPGTATVSRASTPRCHTADRVRRGRTTRKGIPHTTEDNIYYS